MRDLFFNQGLIARRLFFQSVFLSLLAAAVISAVQIYFRYGDKLRSIENELQRIETSHLNSLATNLWHMDESLLRTELKGIMNLPNIQYVEVRSAEGQRIVLGTPGTGDHIARSYPLFFSKLSIPTELGNFTVHADLNSIRRELWKEAAALSVWEAGKIFVIVLLVFFLFQFTVGRHLRNLARQAFDLDLGRTQSPFQLQHPPHKGKSADELEYLSSSLNKLYFKLMATIEDLRWANIVVENSPVVLFRWHAAESWPVEMVSQNISRLGYSQEELLSGGVQFASMVHPEDLERVGREVQEYSASGTDRFEQVYRMLTKDGAVRWVDVHTVVERNDDGLITFYQGIVIDITEHKKTEDALRENEENSRKLIQMIQAAVVVHGPDTRILSCNSMAQELLGLTEDQLLGKTAIDPVWHFFHEDGTAMRFEEYPVNQVIAKRQALSDIIAGVHRPNKEQNKDVWVLINAHPVFVNDEIVQVIVTFVDINERKRTEEALRASEKKYQSLFDNAQVALFRTNISDGKLLEINERYAKMAGYSSVGDCMAEFNAADAWADPNARIDLRRIMLEKGFVSDYEAEIVRRDGTHLWILFSATIFPEPGFFEGSIVDITERKQAEEAKAKFEDQLQQAHKFEAIATLAGGIAHDFNNLLMGIQGRVSLVSLEIETSHPHWEHIQAIEEYIRSATNLTRQLLGLAKGGKYEVKPIDMNELVLSSSAMFGRTKKEIRIHPKCQASPLVVEADRGQIEQVLLNMYINAWQAMHTGGGELYLETKIVTLDEAYCKPHQAEPGRYANVSITDTGTGMDKATCLRIFDPFFTTKEKSRGTGMGLASALGIIKNHGGMITVDSEVGHGTTFNIYLPVSDKEAHREVSMDGSRFMGSATILLIDDEELIVVVCQTMLKKLGYRVIVCRGGLEAVKVITDMGNEIDLVILDMIMPGMDGGTAFDLIREIQPDMPVLLSSGYSINGHADNIIRKGCIGFIQKPYNISELSQKIKKMLDASKGSTPG